MFFDLSCCTSQDSPEKQSQLDTDGWMDTGTDYRCRYEIGVGSHDCRDQEVPHFTISKLQTQESE